MCVTPPPQRAFLQEGGEGSAQRLSTRIDSETRGRECLPQAGEEGIQQRKGKRKSIYCYTLPNKRRRRWQLLNIIGHFFWRAKKEQKIILLSGAHLSTPLCFTMGFSEGRKSRANGFPNTAAPSRAVKTGKIRH